MAELPELRTSLLPDRVGAPRQLFDHAHTYGVARDLDRMRQGYAPAPRAPRIPARLRRLPGSAVRRWWASRDIRPVDIWHRLRCRRGRHDFRGGGLMQLGSRFVYVERRCHWCDVEQFL